MLLNKRIKIIDTFLLFSMSPLYISCTGRSRDNFNYIT